MSKSIATSRRGKNMGCCGGPGIAYQKTNSKKGGASCTGPPAQGSIDLTVKLSTLTGFVIGPESLTFQALKKKDKKIANDLDEWQYVSLVDDQNISYDFKIKTRKESIDFIIAISHAAMMINQNFFGITNRKLVSSYFIRSKLRKIAARRKMTVHQMIMVACYDSCAQLYPENDVAEKKEKYQSLCKLITLCEKMKIDTDE